MSITTPWISWLALLLIVCGIGWLLSQHLKGSGQRRHMDDLLAGEKSATNLDAVVHAERWRDRLVNASADWLNTHWGKQLVADEDRALLVQCGYQTSQSKTYFLLARMGLSLLLPVLAVLFSPLFESTNSKLFFICVAFVVGFLLPKWFLRKKALKRSKQAAKELLIFVDLLGLLQGSGLGVDQSLQLISKDFQDVMPVLSGEMAMVNRLHASGRTREQALLRLSEMFRSDALAELSALIVQIDKYGGAVQEPLRQFGERLREQRRMRMKEDIGKITVKMTGVMVLTLLPSLLIITAGPGFLSVVRALGGMQ